MTHELKTWPQFFASIKNGVKTFEVRRSDRPFCVEDTLVLREFSPVEGYSGRSLTRTVSYVMNGPGFGLEAGFVCMGLKTPSIEAFIEQRINLYRDRAANYRQYKDLERNTDGKASMNLVVDELTEVLLRLRQAQP